MSSGPIPPQLLIWALSSLKLADGAQSPNCSVVAGDASNRRYFRLVADNNSYIVAEAPPATENNEAFLAVRQILAGAGVKVPELYATDLSRGYLLMEDLGSQLMLPHLNLRTAAGLYQEAFGILRQIASLEPAGLELASYDTDLLEEELERFPTWFAQALLGYSPDHTERRMLQSLFDTLVESALAQPQVLVHRDFHSRNLMLQGRGELAVIDFQDAVVGPVTYDLVSLLRDCYVRWPREQVVDWALCYRETLDVRGLLAEVGEARFMRWFDLMGLQRHIKVLGTFARLYLRDGKSDYLDDLPLVIAYVREACHKYADQEATLAEFGEWFEARLIPLIRQQAWSHDL